jgi:uncharacterized protein CbrC (UPF0167 family)
MLLPEFKYFDRPEHFSVFLQEETSCDLCHQTKRCFDGSAFFGEESIQAICPDCLASGKLERLDVFTCEGDMAELLLQLHARHPDLSKLVIEKMARGKTAELEKTTPKLISWQDWPWPCADGDYCTFIGFGSKGLFNSLAEGNDGSWLFQESLYHSVKDNSDGDELWEEAMPVKEIKDFDASQECATLFYVFKSLHSGQLVTIWDAM